MAGTPPRKVSYTYDTAGRVASVRDEIAAGGALVSQFTLGYDALDRIVEETTLPEPAQFAVTAVSMSYDDDDRLTGWNSLVTQSDADGNLAKGPLAGALATFAYDARNRFTSVGGSTFTYDAESYYRGCATASGEVSLSQATSSLLAQNYPNVSVIGMADSYSKLDYLIPGGVKTRKYRGGKECK